MQKLMFLTVAAVFAVAVLTGVCCAQGNGGNQLSQGQTEAITITTYYPSPYGVYKTLRLYPNGDTTLAAGYDCGDKSGEMTYDKDTNAIFYCDGATKQWTAIGFWQRNGTTLNTISGITNIEVNRSRTPGPGNDFGGNIDISADNDQWHHVCYGLHQAGWPNSNAPSWEICYEKGSNNLAFLKSVDPAGQGTQSTIWANVVKMGTGYITVTDPVEDGLHGSAEPGSIAYTHGSDRVVVKMPNGTWRALKYADEP